MQINPIKVAVVEDPRNILKTERSSALVVKDVPKWDKVVALAVKAGESMEERKRREKESTALVKKLHEEKKEREKLKRIREEER